MRKGQFGEPLLFKILNGPYRFSIILFDLSVSILAWNTHFLTFFFDSLFHMCGMLGHVLHKMSCSSNLWPSLLKCFACLLTIGQLLGHRQQLGSVQQTYHYHQSSGNIVTTTSQELLKGLGTYKLPLADSITNNKWLVWLLANVACHSLSANLASPIRLDLLSYLTCQVSVAFNWTWLPSPSLAELRMHRVTPNMVSSIPNTAPFPPNSSPRSRPVRSVMRKVRELTTGTVKESSVVAKVK